MMKTYTFVLLLLYVLVTSKFPPASSANKTEFTAAVFEHVFVIASNTSVVLPRNEALKIMMENVDIYEDQIKKAKQKDVDIIVFPEYGLTGFSYTRQSFRPFLEDIPDPTKVEWNACDDPKANSSTPVLYRLSCLAKEHAMYVVVNMGDVKVCKKSKDENCPSDGRYQFNTNIAFSDKGLLVARYHKQHPFLNEMKTVDRPMTPEYITFDTPFGKFGLFICFDVLFYKPAITLVELKNIDHVAFPTAWFDVLPLFAAIGFHSSWARGMQVNFLGANTHVPKVVNTGSGIYSPEGAEAYYRSLSTNGSLSIATLKAKPNKERRELSLLEAKDIKPNSSAEPFYSNLFGDLFLFNELSEQEDTLKVCYNDTETCCFLAYKMTNKRPDELYALGVFDGLHTLEGQYYLRVCTVIKCLKLDRSSCGQIVNNASTIFESLTLRGELDTSYIFPQVVSDGVSLLPDEWEHNMPVSQLQTKQRLSKGLLTAALFGRVYKYDDGIKDNEVVNASPSFSSPNHLMGLIVLLSTGWYNV